MTSRRWAAALGAGALVVGRSLGRRSGCTDAENQLVLPGDELVPDPLLVCDRAGTMPASADVVWPWLKQIGKGRAGWYFPQPLRLLTDRLPGMYGADHIEADWQDIDVGDRVPDYGPGDPEFRVEVHEPGSALVYLTLRDTEHGHRWPEPEDPLPPGVLALSWGIYLTDLGDGHSRVHLRVRCRPGKRWRFAPVLATGFGLADWVTAAPLFPGLRQRIAAAPHASPRR